MSFQPCKLCLQALVSNEPGPGQSSGVLDPASWLLWQPLVHKGAAGSTAGAGDARCAGIGDTGPNGLAAGVGCGAGVAGQPGEKNDVER